MSHLPERKEKICLNCDTPVNGRFCHSCGQENIEPKESFWHLLTHFFNDITHFDGKFFTTIKDVLFKPGFLSKEYVMGKRIRYLHPIRMYVFTSAIFFIIFFSLFNAKKMIKDDQEKIKIEELAEAKTNLETEIPDLKDSVVKAAASRSLKKISVELAFLQKAETEEQVKDSIARTKASYVFDSSDVGNYMEDSVKKAISKKIKNKSGWQVKNIPLDDITYTSLKAYDAVQQELPDHRKNNWVTNLFIRSGIHFTSEARENKTQAIREFIEKFMHSFPQMLFVSLPFFALILQLLYFNTKRFYYTDHIIFSIHLYCATFIILLAFFGLNALDSAYGLGWLKSLEFLLFILLFFYLYKAMRKFYGQGRGKTILKFLLLEFGSFIMVIILVMIFLSVSFVTT